jgi:predicted ATPase
MLEQAPHLTVLVTSRELLRVRGEHELPVPPLSVDHEAVALFAERAAAASPRFDVALADMRVLADICRRLDGVPLAIELAAPRTRILTPEQLLERLKQHLALSGPRDAPPRQQTLEAAIAWSYELLSADERVLFEQLGVFSGSFTIEAADWVCEAPSHADRLEILAALLDKSMIYRVDRADGTRFAMLGMIRQYALDHLSQHGELDSTFLRLAQLYVRGAADTEHGLRSIEQRRWKRMIDDEADNIRGVLAWLAERGDSDVVVLLRSTWMWFWLTGRLDEWRRWTRRALQQAGGGLAERGWILCIDGTFAMLQGDYINAARQVETARPLLSHAGDRLGLAFVDLAATITAAAAEGEQPALAHLAHATQAFTQLGDAWGIAMSLDVTAWLRTIFARFDDAGDLFERALRTSEQVGDELEIVMALGNMAEAKLASGDTDEAQRAAERALALLRGGGSIYSQPDLLETLARCRLASGDYVGATELVGTAQAVRESMHVPHWGPALERYQRLLAELRQRLGDAEFAVVRDRGRASRSDRQAGHDDVGQVGPDAQPDVPTLTSTPGS